MKRYIRSESDIAKSRKLEMKEVGHALQSAIKSFPDQLPVSLYVDTKTEEVEEVVPRILSSVKAINTTQCFVSVDFNVVIDNSSAVKNDIIRYAINQTANKYANYEFTPGKYGSFRGSDLGVWITRK